MNDSPLTFSTTSDNGAALKQIRQQLGSFARQIDPQGSLGDDVETIVAEILDNIREHNQVGTPVTVRASHGSNTLELEFRDEGIAFDPLQAESPDVDLPVSQRGIGGLGIHIARCLAQQLHYRRSPEGENVLTVQLSLPRVEG